MAGHSFIHVCVGVNDLEESTTGILVDVDAAELSDFVGRISDETDEVSAEVSVNLRSIDVGKVVRTPGATVPRAAIVPAPIPPRIWSKYFAGRLSLARRAGG
jgi:hypothetical protein